MKKFKATIRPQSRFITPLRGDTLFGQICWAIAQVDGNRALTDRIEGYVHTPFLIVSDAFPKGLLPKPTLPGRLTGEDPERKKQNRKKKWITPEDLRKGAFINAIEKEMETSVTTLHNSLDYRSFRTGEDAFAPYGMEERSYTDDLDLYLAIDETRWSATELEKMLVLTGMGGYGKKSSTGKGRFELLDMKEMPGEKAAKSFMTLGPAVLQDVDAKCWYEPFTRFGKHGAFRAKKMPFKHPVLMANRGAVLQYDEVKERVYEGRGMTDISPAYPDTVHQGFSILFAIEEGL